MPRRTSIPRKTKYETIPANRMTARFSAKLMKGGKQNLAERILRQALAGADLLFVREAIPVMSLVGIPALKIRLEISAA